MYHLDQLENIISAESIQNLRNFLEKSKWNYKVPGGFLTNFPQRKVNTYGNGMYVDNDIGGACATGVGELVMKTLGSFLIVELMRQGATPQQACEEGVARIVKKQNYQEMQIGYLAINKKGEHGAYAVHNGFDYALYQNDINKMINAQSFAK